MRLLVFGPGMIGSLVAGKLASAGHEVDVLGRGRRLAQIRAQQIRLRHIRSGAETVAEVGAIESLPADAAYDWIIVAVRADQVDGVLPALSANHGTPNVMIMSNRALGYDCWTDAVGPGRLVGGFPGAGGYIEEGVVHYSIAPRLIQPTTIGEIDGQSSERIRALATALREAGFPTATHDNMDAWQRYHVAWIGVFMLAGLIARGNPDALIADKPLRKKLVRAVREGFRVLGKLGIKRTPGNLRMWTWLPVPWVAFILKRIAGTRDLRLSMEKSGMNQLGEARVVNAEMKLLANKAGVPTPVLDELAATAFETPT